MTAHRCTCLSDDSPLCRSCRARLDAREYAADERVPDYVCDARAADEWARRGA